MTVTEELSESISTSAACVSMGVSRATFYRRRTDAGAQPTPATRTGGRQPRALSPEERQNVIAVMNSERFMDKAPRTIYAQLLDDDGRYLCSARTMYRILAEQGQSRERRNQANHPHHPKPQLRARRPNEVWTWDITKL